MLGFEAIFEMLTTVELTIFFHGKGAMTSSSPLKIHGFEDERNSFGSRPIQKVHVHVSFLGGNVLVPFLEQVIQVNYLGTRSCNMKIHTCLQVLIQLKRC